MYTAGSELLGHWEASRNEHVTILDAIRRRDAQAARTLTEVHIQRLYIYVSPMLGNQP
jgi:DNA-binding GntR family transcriptional regulator